MTASCAEYELLLQADVDGELDAAQAAAVTAHRHQCAHCAAVYAELLSLRQRARTELPYQTANAAFRTALAEKIAAAQATTARVTARPAAEHTLAPEPARSAAAEKPTVRWPWWRLTGAFGAGSLLAACLMLVLITPHVPEVQNEVVSGYVRALQPGHLLDVASTDQHNVKPWFEGKLDFAPPVKNLKDQGFPLIGGRLDYLNQRTVAVMIYQRAKHPINMFAWPTAGAANSSVQVTQQQGYNVQHWAQDGMELWVVSDLNQKELGEFVGLWRNQ